MITWKLPKTYHDVHETLCTTDLFDTHTVFIGFSLSYFTLAKGFATFAKEGERGKNKMGENISMNIVNMNNK